MALFKRLTIGLNFYVSTKHDWKVVSGFARSLAPFFRVRPMNTRQDYSWLVLLPLALYALSNPKVRSEFILKAQGGLECSSLLVSWLHQTKPYNGVAGLCQFNTRLSSEVISPVPDWFRVEHPYFSDASIDRATSIALGCRSVDDWINLVLAVNSGLQSSTTVGSNDVSFSPDSVRGNLSTYNYRVSLDRPVVVVTASDPIEGQVCLAAALAISVEMPDADGLGVTKLEYSKDDLDGIAKIALDFLIGKGLTIRDSSAGPAVQPAKITPSKDSHSKTSSFKYFKLAQDGRTYEYWYSMDDSVFINLVRTLFPGNRFDPV